MLNYLSKYRTKLRGAQLEYVELQGDKKKLEIELETMNLQLTNDKLGQDMTLEKEKHTHGLIVQGKEADLARTKKNHTEDMTRLTSQLKADHDVKLTEAVALAKLESEQEKAQAAIDNKKELLKAEGAFQKELSEYKTKSAKEYYDKITKAQDDLYTKGSTATKFVQDMALTMLEKAPVGDKMTIEHIETSKKG